MKFNAALGEPVLFPLIQTQPIIYWGKAWAVDMKRFPLC